MSRVLASSFFALAFLASAGVAVTPDDGAPALVVVPPWLPAEAGLQIVLDAGGRVLEAESGGRLIRARFDEPDFLSRLYGRGAALVVATGARPCSGTDRA